jgi:hypothetical protein
MVESAGLTFDATFGFPTLPQASQTLKNGSCPGWQNGVIALDGDKLKPRTDQRKGGNGFGINEENVGYTLTVPDRHGVAYKTMEYCDKRMEDRSGSIDHASLIYRISRNDYGEIFINSKPFCELQAFHATIDGLPIGLPEVDEEAMKEVEE